MANIDRMDAAEAAVQALRKDFDDLSLTTQEICTGMAYLVARIEEANREPGSAKLLADAERQFSRLEAMRRIYIQKYPEACSPLPAGKGLKN